MSHAQRRNLEAAANQYLRNGLIGECVATYRQLGNSNDYAQRLREQGNESLRHGDRTTAIGAFVAASFLEVGARHTTRPARRRVA